MMTIKPVPISFNRSPPLPTDQNVFTPSNVVLLVEANYVVNLISCSVIALLAYDISTYIRQN